MSIRRFAIPCLPLALAMMPTACGTPRLVENYEVLSTPVASSLYEAGRGWNTQIGSPDTVRNADVKVTIHNGLAKLEAGNTTDLNAKIEVPVIQWIGGSLGIKSTEKIKLAFQGLKHAIVTDAKAMTGTGAVLWEAVTADSMTLTIDTSSDTSLDIKADVVKAKLANAGSVGLAVTRKSTGNYSISSDKPLVVMIRVVELDWATRGGDTPLDLSTAGRNREQMAMLDYRVKPGDPFDHVEKKVSVSVHNDGFPKWEGATFTTKLNNDSWVNERREVIASGDAVAKNARFVWDTMRVIWDDDLTNCKLHTLRQYLTLRNAESGLKGTR